MVIYCKLTLLWLNGIYFFAVLKEILCLSVYAHILRGSVCMISNIPWNKKRPLFGSLPSSLEGLTLDLHIFSALSLSMLLFGFFPSAQMMSHCLPPSQPFHFLFNYFFDRAPIFKERDRSKISLRTNCGTNNSHLLLLYNLLCLCLTLHLCCLFRLQALEDCLTVMFIQYHGLALLLLNCK